jgi:phage FluMu protein Com
MRPNDFKNMCERVRIDFIPREADGECRCKNCKKLLAKIKDVDKRMVLEIKCTRAHCGLLNTFEVRRNESYLREDQSEDLISFKFDSQK